MYDNIYCVCIVNSYGTLLNWPIVLIHDYTLCFTGSPYCKYSYCKFSYYNYISIWPYYIVIHMIIYREYSIIYIYVIEFKGNVGFLPHHSVTTTSWIPKLPKSFHEICICIYKKNEKVLSYGLAYKNKLFWTWKSLIRVDLIQNIVKYDMWPFA